MIINFSTIYLNDFILHTIIFRIHPLGQNIFQISFNFHSEI